MSTKDIAKFYEDGHASGDSGKWGAFVPHHLHQHRIDRMVATIEKLEIKEVLDVGCGIGVLAEHLDGIVERYVGVDPAKSLIEDAKTYRGYGYTHYIHGTVKDVKERFEAVACIGVLTHLRGVAVHDFLLDLSEKAEEFLILEAQHCDHYKGEFASHHPETLMAILSACGFQAMKVEFDVTKDSTFQIACWR